MPWWLQTLLGLAIALLLAWVALLVVLLVGKPKGPLLKEALRLLPDLLRLLRRLAADPSLPRGVRVRLGLLMVYLAIPIDAVRAHWPGSDDGFAALCRLTGLRKPKQSTPGSGEPV